ncbi:hypothetical protein M407DRAFT_123609 [Tulasnella calospora MUT 4182]|uniref:Uncharacterized protein n=1 Tax=Tulasnella calospora MUT 4182 TaxID=1051891 RepID=A0A0C3KJY5_9AGAM|nr:hypothetical protein M407DRAFT_123609 [Tulasnella calospora MUT 4182]
MSHSVPGLDLTKLVVCQVPGTERCWRRSMRVWVGGGCKQKWFPLHGVFKVAPVRRYLTCGSGAWNSLGTEGPLNDVTSERFAFLGGALFISALSSESNRWSGSKYG